MFARVRTIASRPGTVRVTIEAAMVMAHARKSRRVSVVGVKRQSAELATAGLCQKETMLPVSFHRCVATIQWQLV